MLSKRDDDHFGEGKDKKWEGNVECTFFVKNYPHE